MMIAADIAASLTRAERKCVRGASPTNWRGAGRHWPSVRRALVEKGVLDSNTLLTAIGVEVKAIVIEERSRG